MFSVADIEKDLPPGSPSSVQIRRADHLGKVVDRSVGPTQKQPNTSNVLHESNHAIELH